MEVIEVTEREIEVIEVIERGPQGPQGAGITTLTTQGDLLYRGATTGERLPIGTTGQILKVSSGGIPEWGAAPSSGVSSVSGTSPIVSSGGATPAISITAATTSVAGSMSAADKTKLDGIASGAEVNVNADWNASSGDAQILNKPTIPSTAADVGAVPTSRTITSGTGLTGGGDLSANRTLTVSYGTTAGTACQGNDGRIANINSSSVTTIDGNDGGVGGTINLAGWESSNGGSLTMNAEGYGNGGSINTSDGGGSITTTQGGGSIDTRGTGSIQFGVSGTRTTLTGTATADRAVSLPNNAGTLALTSDITKTAVGLGNVANVDTTNAANISSGVLPNARVNWAAPSAIGSTTAAAGTFTTLNANNGTLTASAPVLDLSQTWNNASVTFTALKIAVTNTASASTSALADFAVGAASMFSVTRTGSMVAGASAFAVNGASGNTGLWNGGAFGWSSSATATSSIALDTTLFRDSANTLAQRNGTNPQTFRLYNTYTDASNYERAKIAWSSNVLQIGTEKAGTGSARALEFQTDGITRAQITTGGNFRVSNQLILDASGAVNVRLLAPDGASILMTDSGQTTFGRLQFGGQTSSFPAIKRSSAILQARLADDSGYTVLDAQLRAQGTAPATSGATGTAGDIRYDADYIYVCTATNTWKRAAIATW